MVSSVIIFIIVLSVLVLIHEGGHYFAAKRIGVWVEEFGLGLPPRAWGKKVGETIYSLNWLPFGGFVRLHGENLEDSITNTKVAFLHKGKLARAFVITAGVIMNLVLGLTAFSIVYTVRGIPEEVPTGRVVVKAFSEDSRAREAGLEEGDVIKSINGIELSTSRELIDEVNSHVGEKVTLDVERGTDTEVGNLVIEIDPKDVPAEEGALGIQISSSDLEYRFPPIWQRPFYGIYYGLGDAIFWGKTVVLGLKNLVVDLVAGHVPADIAGPVGIYQITSETAALGILPLINFIGVLSVNLAIVNILPLPALDGGRLVFIIFEAITRKRVTPKIEAYIHAAGMAALLLLLVLITFVDIKRLGAAGELPGFLQQFFN